MTADVERDGFLPKFKLTAAKDGVDIDGVGDGEEDGPRQLKERIIKISEICSQVPVVLSNRRTATMTKEMRRRNSRVKILRFCNIYIYIYIYIYI